ncbi:GGDEF domain-containing protein [Chitiniphilus purpureus]|uniref:diguanylate cyclase n=1 Tax=Chitiniphilus purpureus TaxID=2981137 RepID=A0ABY6DNL6_9NEIS|nr:GGDEF domain-containing protein [Chitiniphilus sp. CD1]UXY15969.1 GGDEF domain-containing protein [Chitiniphilus sp. CD1]
MPDVSTLPVWIAALGWLVAAVALAGWRRGTAAARQWRERFEAQQGRDPLTGLANRAAFLERAEHEVNRSQRAGHALSVLLVDIDGMRQLNSRYGHRGGDLALLHVIDACRRAVRDFDVIGRFSGQEVALLLPDTVREGALRVVERIHEQVAASPVALSDGRSFTVQVTAGVAELISEVEDAEDLLLLADGSLRRNRQRRAAQAQPPAG